METTHDPTRTFERFLIVYGPELATYCFGAEHPLQADRYLLTLSLLRSLGWLDTPGVEFETPRPATLSELMAVHSYPYIQAVQQGQAIARGERPGPTSVSTDWAHLTTRYLNICTTRRRSTRERPSKAYRPSWKTAPLTPESGRGSTPCPQNCSLGFLHLQRLSRRHRHRARSRSASGLYRHRRSSWRRCPSRIL